MPISSIVKFNNFFSKKELLNLLAYGSSPLYESIIAKYISNPQLKTNRQIINEIYSYLRKKQRNEYFYLNTIFNKFICGIHNVNTTTALSQLRIGESIADFITINGEGKVYEIKSDLDNLNRLDSQIKEYYKVFSIVSVLVSPFELNNVKKRLDNLGDMGKAVGIYVLSNKITISMIDGRNPLSFNKFLNHYAMFAMLRKKEYESIIIKKYRKLPSVASVFYFKNCFDQFKKIPILEAQNLVFNELKKRNAVDADVFKKIPMELKSLIYFNRLSSDKQKSVISFLDKKYGGF